MARSKEVSTRAKEIRRETDPSTIGRRLQTSHTQPIGAGGKDDLTNAMALTLPEHCLLHTIGLRRGEARGVNGNAVEGLLKQMSKSEREEYWTMIKSRRERMGDV